MTFTSKILLALLIILISGLLVSNVILKKEYDKVNKSDIYWNYETVLSQPFKYLRINGGNTSNITFEQGPNYSVRILNQWKRNFNGGIRASVEKDTLIIDYYIEPANPFEKFWMQRSTTVRIFAPELLIIDGFNTNLEMFRLKQKTLSVNMSGRSNFEAESLFPAMDSVHFTAKDSSILVLEMSPEYKPLAKDEKSDAISLKLGTEEVNVRTPQAIQSKEAMYIRFAKASLEGYTLLDLGHAQIDSLQLSITDSSAIILSGQALKKRSKN